MKNRFRPVVLMTIGSIIVVGVFFSYAYLSRNTSSNGIWQFNFSPTEAPEFDSFVTVSSSTDYNSWRGYGWLDAAGSTETGHWPGDKWETWESRANLNLVARRGPDNLARSFATGEATFALDLEPGQYEVWVLSGDSGHLEYTPWQAYNIMVEGTEAYHFSTTAQQYHRRFETPVLQDELTEADIWQNYVEPRFKWSKVQIEIADGQLNVVVAGAERDRSKLGLAGDYPHTEGGRGPKKRYTGAINALVVVPLDNVANIGTEIIAQIDAARRKNFHSRWRMEAPRDNANKDLTPADYERGYTVYVPHILETIYPTKSLPHRPKTVSLRATPGETVSLTLAIKPLKEIGETSLEFFSLRGPAGAYESVADIRAQIDIGVVRYVARAIRRKGSEWRPRTGHDSSDRKLGYAKKREQAVLAKPSTSQRDGTWILSGNYHHHSEKCRSFRTYS